MRTFGFILLVMGLFLSSLGYIVPVNKYSEIGLDRAQDCDGPMRVMLFLVLAFIFSGLGLAITILNRRQRTPIVLGFGSGLFAISILIMCIKLPAVMREFDYNSRAESSCSG